MKPKYISIFILLFFAKSACTQENFGDDFNKWVNNQAYTTSVKFIHTHYNLFFENYYTALQEDGLKLIEDGLKLNTFLNDFDTTSLDFNASLQYKVKIQKFEINYLQFAIELQAFLERCSYRDSVNTKKHYVNYGYYHIGTTSLLESLMAVSTVIGSVNNPSVSVAYNSGNDNITFSYDPNTTDNEYVEAFKTTLYAITLAYAPEFIGIVQFVYFAYDMWRAGELEKQNKKFEKALAILPSKVPDFAEAFNLYKTSHEKISAVHQPFTDSIYNNIQFMDSILALKRKQILSIERFLDNKLKQIIEFDGITNEEQNMKILNRFYLIGQLKKEEETQLKKINECSGFNFIQSLENLKFTLQQNTFLFDTLTFNEVNQQLLTTIKKYGENTKNRLNVVETLLRKKIKAEKPSSYKKILNSKPFTTSYYTSSFTDLLPKKQSNNNFEKLKVNAIVEEEFAGFIYLNIIYKNSSGFELGLGKNSTYHNQFYNQNYGTDVLNSPFDGGYKSDIREATASIEAMKENLSSRINAMENSYRLLKEYRDNRINQNAERLEKTRVLSNKTRIQIMKTLQKTSGVIDDQYYNEFKAIISGWLGKPYATSIFNNPYRQYSPILNSPEIQQTFNNINNKVNFEKNVGKGVNNGRYLRSIYDLQRSYEFGSEDLTNDLLSLTQYYRYKTNGYRLNPPDGFMFDLQKSIINKIESKFYSFWQCAPSGNLANNLRYSDCNRFTAHFLKEIYGYSDFLDPSGSDNAGDGNIYLNTTDLRNRLPNERWKIVGMATNKNALLDAQFLANIGKPVIAIGPGHVTVIVPGELIWSGNWNNYVPSVINYRSTRTAENRNPRGTRVNIIINGLNHAFSNNDRNEVIILYRD